jgi:hypothetical protein
MTVNTVFFHASQLIVLHRSVCVPHSIFAVGYLLLLSCFPVLFVFSRCYVTISRQALPLLFRLISTYSGVVICLLYIFLADDLSGISIDRHVGQDLHEYGALYPSPAAYAKLSTLQAE